MIDIHFRPPEGRCGTLIVTGHSGTSERGSDIVCAGVSSLVLTYLGGLEVSLNASIRGHLDNGQCNVVTEVPPEKASLLQDVYNIFRFGFQQMAKTYPDNVRLFD